MGNKSSTQQESEATQAEIVSLSDIDTMEQPNIAKQDGRFLRLPGEILLQIATHLHCQSLVSLSRTCRQLRSTAFDDKLWANLLRPYIPDDDYPLDPYPSASYRDLYITHHPYWFVPQQKLWISDDPHTGRVMLCKFDSRRGCIEGYRLLAERGPSQSLYWPYNLNVMIHTFTPRVHLWMDDPVLKLPHDIVPFNTKQGWWEGEIKMSVGRPGHNTSASFFLARDLPNEAVGPGTEVWPPRTIPEMPRVRAASSDKFRGKGHKPQKYDEISQTTFRMRHWSQFSSGMSHLGVRIGEEVSTWSTLDPALYTPTPEKPYQGIYVGDYAGHGCEFLLVMHTDKAPFGPERGDDSIFSSYRLRAELIESSYAYDDPNQTSHQAAPSLDHMPADAAARDPEASFHGALEAIKLTGDPNIPRGEHTFIADNIGSGGFIRNASEHPFCGARVVKSRGHVAARGFLHGKSYS